MEAEIEIGLAPVQRKLLLISYLTISLPGAMRCLSGAASIACMCLESAPDAGVGRSLVDPSLSVIACGFTDQLSCAGIVTSLLTGAQGTGSI